MPQEGYGRNIKAQSDYGATRRAYQYSPKAAEEYLTGDQAAAYQSAKTEAFRPYTAGAGFRAARPEIAKREQAFDRMDRLRDIAGVNALGDFTKAAGQLSKPYKMQAEQGFLTEPEEAQASDTEPVMTAHPGRMAKSDTDTWGDVRSWADRRHSLENRTYKPDEGFNLLKDDDSRLKLRAQLESKKLIGLGMPTLQMPASPWGRNLTPKPMDPYAEYGKY